MVKTVFKFFEKNKDTKCLGQPICKNVKKPTDTNIGEECFNKLKKFYNCEDEDKVIWKNKFNEYEYMGVRKMLQMDCAKIKKSILLQEKNEKIPSKYYICYGTEKDGKCIKKQGMDNFIKPSKNEMIWILGKKQTEGIDLINNLVSESIPLKLENKYDSITHIALDPRLKNRLPLKKDVEWEYTSK